jgi:virulence factor Mce-like protein
MSVLSSRTRVRGKRRRDSALPGPTVLKGLIVLALIGGLIYLSVTFIDGVPLERYHYFNVDAPQVGDLAQHDEVSIGGVRVGQVASVKALTDGDAQIRLQIDPGTKLPTGTTALIRANGLLGARYVQLIAGKQSTDLKAGATITAGSNSLTYGVPDLLDTFNQQTRGATAADITALGTGLSGNGQALNDGIYLSSNATIPFQQIFNALKAEPAAVESLLPRLDSGMDALAANRTGLTNLFAPANTALAPFATQRAQLRATLQDAPSALTTATAGLTQGTQLLGAVDTLAVAARSTLVDAPGALKQTNTLLTDAETPVSGGPTPLNGLNTLLKSARPGVDGALSITASLKPTLPYLKQTLTTFAPMVSYIGSYGCDLINFGETMRSMTGFGGTGAAESGPLGEFRLQAVAGVESLGLPETNSVRNAYAAPCQYGTIQNSMIPNTLRGTR